MNFKTLKSYLGFRAFCPFCKKSLYNKADTFLRGDNIVVKPQTTLNNIIKFDLLEKANDHLSQFDDKGYYLKFGITLFDKLKLGYRLKSAFEQEKEFPKERFIDLFNRSHINIISFCKQCQNEYFTTSLPLRANESGITEYTLYTESIRYKRYLAQNNFIDNKLQIYVDNCSDLPPIETDLFDLNKNTADKFITRVKVAVTFS